MKIAVFDTHRFDREALEQANQNTHTLSFFDARLNAQTAALAADHQAVCVFVNDHLDSTTIANLAQLGVKLIALRCAGFNNVDLEAAQAAGISVVRVPEYSPAAVAEHAVALLLSLNRKIHRAYNRVRDGNFALDGLVGFDLKGKTVGIVGTGKIGACFARIMRGFGSNLLAFDLYPNSELAAETGLKYVELSELFSKADVISLHVPLSKETYHLVNDESLASMKDGVFILNTSRGALIDTPCLIESLKDGKVGAAALDVYEEEEQFFFQDLSGKIIKDDVLARLLTYPNVLITSHQAFLTNEALEAIASTTVNNVNAFEKGEPLENRVERR